MADSAHFGGGATLLALHDAQLLIEQKEFRVLLKGPIRQGGQSLVDGGQSEANGWVQPRQQTLLFHPAIELLDESLETAAADQVLIGVGETVSVVLRVNEGMVELAEPMGRQV